MFFFSSTKGLLNTKNAPNKDETIAELKSQLMDHEGRIFHLEKMMSSQLLSSSMSRSTNYQQSNNGVDSKHVRKRPVRLLYNRLSQSE